MFLCFLGPCLPRASPPWGLAFLGIHGHPLLASPPWGLFREGGVHILDIFLSLSSSFRGRGCLPLPFPWGWVGFGSWTLGNQSLTGWPCPIHFCSGINSTFFEQKIQTWAVSSLQSCNSAKQNVPVYHRHRLPGDPWPSPVGIASLGISGHPLLALPPWGLFHEADLRFREPKSKQSKVFDSFDSLINWAGDLSRLCFFWYIVAFAQIRKWNYCHVT